MSIKLLIVDDHPVVRRGLKSLLSTYEDFDILGEAEDFASGVTQIEQLNPDIVLLDIRLPGQSGLDLLDWIKRHHPKLKVIILTSFDDDEHVQRALSRGAHGYILKSGSDEMLADAIRAVYHNGRVLSSQVTEQLMARLSEDDDRSHLDAREPDFNEEERQILKLLVDGANNDEIASELFMSVATVKRRLQKIFTKLNVDNRSRAIAETVRRKLLS